VIETPLPATILLTIVGLFRIEATPTVEVQSLLTCAVPLIVTRPVEPDTVIPPVPATIEVTIPVRFTPLPV
jgi:hypothetical protein